MNERFALQPRQLGFCHSGQGHIIVELYQNQQFNTRAYLQSELNSVDELSSIDSPIMCHGILHHEPLTNKTIAIKIVQLTPVIVNLVILNFRL